MIGMLDALPRPPLPTHDRSQLEAFAVLRRNPLELWGARAYEAEVLPGRFFGRPQLLLNAPEAVRQVLVSNADNYGRNSGTRRVLAPIIGEGLFLAEGAAWRHQRRTIAPAMAPRATALLARHIVAATASYEPVLDGLANKAVELTPHLQRLALSIAGQSMFSLEMADSADRLRALLMRYAERFAKPGALDLLLPARMASPLDRGRARFRTDWLAFVNGLVERRLAQPAAAAGPRDLFDLLWSARDPEDGSAFSRAQLCDEVATMIVAGHETTAVTLFWACYLAARLPEQQARLAEEAAGVALEEADAAEALAKLPLIRAHVDETLRLYPPAFMIVREALGADEVAGHRVVKGTVVVISPWLLHRHRARWRDPDEFDASRFAPGAAAPERFSYLPFGAGPRVCVGAQFALTEAVLVLARLLRRYRLELFGGKDVVPRGVVTTQPDRAVWFGVGAR
jgi:unspecific monooxygenase